MKPISSLKYFSARGVPNIPTGTACPTQVVNCDFGPANPNEPNEPSEPSEPDESSTRFFKTVKVVKNTFATYSDDEDSVLKNEYKCALPAGLEINAYSVAIYGERRRLKYQLWPI